MVVNEYFKIVELRDASDKYGDKETGIFALKDIKKGEIAWRCDPLVCNDDSYFAISREEINELGRQNSDCKHFIDMHTATADHDLYYTDKNLLENKCCTCLLVNHSCEPNVYFNDNDTSYVARRDIKAGEELKHDYQTVEMETSRLNGLVCKCGSAKCRGKLTFDEYRKNEWATENYEYCTSFMRKRIDELKTKWFSSKCYVKKYNNKQELGLTALRFIQKDELVAVFSDLTSISPKSHYLRHSDSPTCYIKEDGQVYASADIQPETELTVTF